MLSGGTPNFKWHDRWSKDFFGFEILDFGIFWGSKNLASNFLGFKTQPRPQGAFPWLPHPASKAREKRPGDEVVQN